MELGGLAKHAQKLISNNSSLILTTIGVTGALTTAILSGLASFKAAEDLSAEQVARDLEGNETPIEFKEKVGIVWRHYMPAAASAALTVAAIIGTHRVGTRTAAAFASAYTISEKAFTEYRKKVTEKIGATKEEAIRAEIAQERADQNLHAGRDIIYASAKSDVLLYDMWTDRRFMGTVTDVHKAVNTINHKLLHDFSATLSDFYQELNLPTTSESDYIGWNSDNLLEVSILGIRVDDEPALAIDFRTRPHGTHDRTF
jgi:hypothetical protein